MRHLRCADYVEMAWVNGGGVTTQVARFPEAGAFDWRISMAQVIEDGPFSEFPGITRSLAILSGDGVELGFEGGTLRITPESGPQSFAADTPTRARLLGAAVVDLNVMTRRGAYTHRVTRLRGPGVYGICPRAETTVLLANATAWSLGEGTLLPLESAVLVAGDRPVDASAQGTGELFVIEITPV